MKIPVQSQPTIRSTDTSELILEVYDLMRNSSQIQASACTFYCAGLIIGNTGHSPSKNNAKRNARIKWRRKVKNTPLLGDVYANWDCANPKSYVCSRKWGIWRCSAWGYPCANY